jgi:hypothetical protein
VSNWQFVRYCDDLLADLETGKPYEAWCHSVCSMMSSVTRRARRPRAAPRSSARSVASSKSGWRCLSSEQCFGDYIVPKDWRGTVQLAPSGRYEAGTTARWLSQHFTAEGNKNFGSLMRVYLLAPLARGRDLVQVVRPAQPDAPITRAEITTDSGLLALLTQMETKVLRLADIERNRRKTANSRIGAAIHFLSTPPFRLAQESR